MSEGRANSIVNKDKGLGRGWLARIRSHLQLARMRHGSDRALREEAHTLETLNWVGAAVAAELKAIGKVRVLAGRIDAAIIDVGLPDRKGDALAAELRAMSGELPIVMASGHLREAVMARFDGDRFVGFVGKPYDRERLASALRVLSVEAPVS